MVHRAGFVFAVVLAVAGCGGGDEKPSDVASMETVVTPSADSTTGSEPTSAPATTPATTTTKTKAPATSAAPSGPQIVYFRIKTKASCGSNPPYADPIPGSITLEWKVTGADNVSISIDGPGAYREDYPVEHSEKFNFSCSGPSNSTQKHTYLLKTVGGGTVRSKTITGEARVN